MMLHSRIAKPISMVPSRGENAPRVAVRAPSLPSQAVQHGFHLVSRMPIQPAFEDQYPHLATVIDTGRQEGEHHEGLETLAELADGKEQTDTGPAHSAPLAEETKSPDPAQTAQSTKESPAKADTSGPAPKPKPKGKSSAKLNAFFTKSSKERTAAKEKAKEIGQKPAIAFHEKVRRGELPEKTTARRFVSRHGRQVTVNTDVDDEEVQLHFHQDRQSQMWQTGGHVKFLGLKGSTAWQEKCDAEGKGWKEASHGIDPNAVFKKHPLASMPLETGTTEHHWKQGSKA